MAEILLNEQPHASLGAQVRVFQCPGDDERLSEALLMTRERHPRPAEYTTAPCERMYTQTKTLRPQKSTNLPQGMLDELFAIEDGLLTMQHGSIKEARYVSESLAHSSDLSGLKLDI